MYSHCADGGSVLGHMIDGTQTEFLRIPHADNSLHPLPAGADEEALVMLSDILPIGYECGVLNGKVAPGSSVAIIGAGPIGLATLLTAQFYAPERIVMIDLDDHRLAVARKFGATHMFNSTRDPVVRLVRDLTEGKGVDTVSRPMLLKTVESKRLQPEQLVTHRFTLPDILDAYETFSNAADTGALKVVIAA